MRHWLSQQAAGSPLVHSVPPERRGWPSVSFVAIVEAYVLRALRSLDIPTHKIREAAADIREQFGNEYALATRRFATDGIDVFIHHLDSDVAEVVIDPRFAWGAPIVEPAKVPVEAVLSMWRAGEPPDVVADEYGLSVDQVNTLIRVAA